MVAGGLFQGMLQMALMPMRRLDSAQMLSRPISTEHQVLINRVHLNLQRLVHLLNLEAVCNVL